MLKQRVITGILALIIVLGALISGPALWQGLVYAACLLCVSEFSVVTGQRWFALPTLAAYAVVTILMWAPHWLLTATGLETAVAVALVIPVVLRNAVTFTQTSSLFIGALYIGFGGHSLSSLRWMGHGLAWVLLLMVSIWATDTVAYFVGSWLKGPKLWPSISPKKTLSGALAGMMGGAVAAGILGATLLHSRSLLDFCVLGIIISVLGQLGDLVESAYKRVAGLKDSGRLLPGHGGILDRVDSLLFAAPFAAYFIVVANQGWLG
jgi:phosphatidate cytidylyltransferase